MNSSDALLARRYAAAYVFPSDTGRSPREEFAALADCVRKLDGARTELRNPLIPQEIKLRVLAELLAAEKDTRPFRFLELLLKVKRFYLLDAVFRECDRQLDEHDGIVRAEVESAFAPEAASAAEAERVLCAMTGKKVSVSMTENPELIAGLRMRLGDTLIDASLQGRLNRLKRKIAG